MTGDLIMTSERALETNFLCIMPAKPSGCPISLVDTYCIKTLLSTFHVSYRSTGISNIS